MMWCYIVTKSVLGGTKNDYTRTIKQKTSIAHLMVFSFSFVTLDKNMCFFLWLFFVLLFFMIFVIQTSQITSFRITRSVGHPQNYSECILNRSKHIVVIFGVNAFITYCTQQLLSYTVFMVGVTNTFLFCLINNLATYGVLWNVKMCYSLTQKNVQCSKIPRVKQTFLLIEPPYLKITVGSFS